METLNQKYHKITEIIAFTLSGSFDKFQLLQYSPETSNEQEAFILIKGFVKGIEKQKAYTLRELLDMYNADLLNKELLRYREELIKSVE